MSFHYQTRRPHPALAPYVECFWLLTAGADPSAPPEIVMPDGKTELIVHFGDAFQKRDAQGRYDTQAGVLFAGQLTTATALRSTGAVGIVAARFKAAGASRFFDFPLKPMTDQVVDFEAVAGRSLNELRQRILEAPTNDARIALVERWLIARLGERDDDRIVRCAVERIVASDGAIPLSELAREIGFSERQLERRFDQKVGVSPKTLARILRLQRFLQLAGSGAPLVLTDAALACGYYDQSHFNRDFKAFAGLSPSAFLAGPRALTDLFSSDDSSASDEPAPPP
jgi:AraC-like DNA-binding protein